MINEIFENILHNVAVFLFPDYFAWLIIHR
ncbi:unnamed protein product [Onchocerca flexuosa]|uniref:Uncharacterized protein n=1 Tax=Onchocerca flexuosa TaxID=387005 RepID=A0A183HVJ4_9BILA|nr:unnamed protein product [Onchocerca flexuosa]